VFSLNLFHFFVVLIIAQIIDNKRQPPTQQAAIDKTDSPNERPSPQDRINRNDIHIYQDRVVIDIQNAQISSYAGTGSMDPVIDKEANGIEIIPKSPDEIWIGDIVSYKPKTDNNTIIVHRIINTAYDKEGWYATFKGDNNKKKDPEKVRFEQIQDITIAIIY